MPFLLELCVTVSSFRFQFKYRILREAFSEVGQFTKTASYLRVGKKGFSSLSKLLVFFCVTVNETISNAGYTCI